MIPTWLVKPRMGLVQAKASAARTVLGAADPDGPAVERAARLLEGVQADLADMEAGADTRTADALRALRSEVGGHVLAATTLRAAGAPTTACAAVLLRAGEAVEEGLRSSR
jgi:hypothetical protein